MTKALLQRQPRPQFNRLTQCIVSLVPDIQIGRFAVAASQFTKTLKPVLLAASIVVLENAGFAQQPGDKIWAFSPSTDFQYMSSPALGANGTIYIGSYNNVLYAVNPDGTEQWHFGSNGPLFGSPVVGPEGTIYFGTVGGSVYALDRDGNQRWTFAADSSIYSSPTLASDGTVYFRSAKGTIYALRSNGTNKWFTTVADGGLTSSLAVAGDGTIYTGSTNGLLHAFNPDGTSKWRTSISGTTNYVWSPSIASDGTIYCGFQRGLAAITQSGTLKWTYPAPPIRTSATIGPDGSIYFGGDGTFLSLDSNGNKRWQFDDVSEYLSSPALSLDGTVYFGAGDALFALDSSGHLIWTFNTKGQINTSSPVIGNDGSVFIGSSDFTLYSIKGTSPLAQSSWPMFQQNVRHTSAVNSRSPVTNGVFVYVNGVWSEYTSNVVIAGDSIVNLESTYPKATIFYTLDGSIPTFRATRYTNAFVVPSTTTIRAVAYDDTFTQTVLSPTVQVSPLPVMNYSLRANTGGGGSVIVFPMASSYPSGTVVTVSALPSNGWTFLRWIGDVNGTNATLQLPISSRTCVSAVFGTLLSTMTVGAGSIMPDTSQQLLPYGTRVRLTAVPNAGNYFVSWGNALTGSDMISELVISNASPTVSSLFGALRIGESTILLTQSGLGRVVIDPALNVYTNGQMVTLHASSETNQTFFGWSGDLGVTNRDVTVTMNGGKSITAHFTRRATFSTQPFADGGIQEGFTFSFDGEAGARYDVQVSTNLMDWAFLETIILPFRPMQYQDKINSNGMLRFYRAAEPTVN